MPYKNMPQSMWGRMDKCVSDVQGKGHDKQSSIAICYSSLMKGKELSETLKSFRLKAAPNYRITQKASDKPSDYLIVEDKTAPTTWHLQVKKNGTPDHTLMGAAWAALHGGYRGNKYEGPNKDKAIAELKRLYDEEKMQTPTEKSITDAPNLRGDDIQRCLNCKYSQAIITEDAMPDVAMASDASMQNTTMMETRKEDGIGLVCTQYDFQTECDWVCDGYEAIPPQSDVTVTKEASGHYRWFGISSSSYQDRDSEIVSQKALEQDTERMNATGNFGNADWWHTPIDLASCDVSFMHDHVSIESGLFHDDWVGEQFSKMKGLGMSRTFINPANEPDADGIYHNIRTIKRAFLPEERASNRLTMVNVSAKENNMNFADKAKDLANRFIKVGVAEDVANAKASELLNTGTMLDSAAKEANIQQKETAPIAPEATTEQPAAPESKAWFVGDMTPEEFDTRLEKAVVKFMTPAIKEIGEQVNKMNEAQAVTAKSTGDKLAASIKSTQDMQTDFAARLAALEGLKPRGYRPTEDPKTKVDKEVVTQKTPKGDTQSEHSVESWIASHLPVAQK